MDAVEITSINMEMVMVRTTAVKVKRSVIAMRKKNHKEVLETKIEKLLKEFPQTKDILREREVKCEGCYLSKVVDLKEAFKCHGISDKKVMDEIVRQIMSGRL